METTQPAMLSLKQMRRANSDVSGHHTSDSSTGHHHPTPATTGGGAKLGALFKMRDSAPTSSSNDGASSKGGGLGAFLRGRSLRNSVTSMIQMRRVSKAIGLLKGTGSANSTLPRAVNMENTYKMSPDDNSQFSTSKVTKVAEAILAETLGGMKYNANLSKELAGTLSCKIKDGVKRLGFRRYKIVCQVVIGERRDQGLEVATRCLWSTDTDDWACANFSNDTIFAVAMIHGAYFE